MQVGKKSFFLFATWLFDLIDIICIIGLFSLIKKFKSKRSLQQRWIKSEVDRVVVWLEPPKQPSRRKTQEQFCKKKPKREIDIYNIKTILKNFVTALKVLPYFHQNLCHN